MSAPASRVMSIGLVVMLLSVSTGMHLAGFGLLLCFMGVLVGASLVAVGVRMADRPAPNPFVPVEFGGGRAAAVVVRCNVATVGLVMASAASTAVCGEEDLVLCFGRFALLLLGLTLVNITLKLTLTGNQSLTAATAAATTHVIEPNS